MKRLALAPLHFCLTQLPPRVSVALQFLHAHATLPDLRNPKTFNEKIQYRKLFLRDERFSLFSDKVRAKDVAAGLIGRDYIIPTLWHGTRLPPPAERPWPTPFVMKANHASGWNSFVRTDAERNWSRLEAEFDQYINTPWPAWRHEPWYDDIERRILIEPIIGTPDEPLVDYKFFVFHGSARYIQVDLDRFSQHTRLYFDPDWNLQDFSMGFARADKTIPKPVYLKEMLHAAETLGSQFDFVRIDLYATGAGPKFGEFTFAPRNGFGRFSPVGYDRVFGDLWDLGIGRRT